MTPLATLADRVEASEGPSRELDLAIALALGEKGLNGSINISAHRTASLDAAMGLVPDGADVRLDSAGWYAVVNNRAGSGATAALALVAAALRARASASA